MFFRVKEDQYQAELIGKQLEDLHAVEPGLAWDSSAIDAAIGAGFGVGVAPKLEAYVGDILGSGSYDPAIPSYTPQTQWNNFSRDDSLGTGFESCVPAVASPWNSYVPEETPISSAIPANISSALEGLTPEEIENLSVDDLIALTGKI